MVSIAQGQDLKKREVDVIDMLEPGGHAYVLRERGYRQRNLNPNSEMQTGKQENWVFSFNIFVVVGCVP